MDPMQVFDGVAVRRHKARAARGLGRVRPVLEALAAVLLDRLDDSSVRFEQALALGGQGVIAPGLRARGMAVVSAELAPVAGHGEPMLVASPEWLPFAPRSFDLIVAPLCLHWVNDLPGALVQLRAALRPNGLLLASVPVLGTLAELRDALAEAELALTGGVSPRVSPFPDLRDCAGLLQRTGYASPVADVQEMVLMYRDPLGLLRDLRAAGEGNAVAARSRRVPPRALFAQALAALPQEDGRIRATLRLAVLTGWASPV